MSATTATRFPTARRTSLSGTAPTLATRASPSPTLGRAAVATRPRPLSLSTSVSARKAAPLMKSPIKETNGVHVDELPMNLGNETLILSLRRETEEKEELLVKLQNKEQQITTIQEEADNLSSALNAAESRLSEVYGDQERMESEMEGQIKLIEKLRAQVRDIEKEKREVQRRYNEQTTSFDAERQSFYDNENHLKSRIQSLSQLRKKAMQEPPSPSIRAVSIAPETDIEEEEEAPAIPAEEAATPAEGNDEPPEMMALRLELETLTVSHTSLQATTQLLQAQLHDLQRVNNALQEENESYNILLRERTLTGQFDATRFAGASSASGGPSSVDEDDDRSIRSGTRSLHRVPEVDETLVDGVSPTNVKKEDDGHRAVSPRSGRPRPGRRGTGSPPPRGENLGDLPITGPGLDLASELGRAENKDITEGRSTADEKFGRKNKADEPNADVAALRSEVKALKDANKALSLYASKILDRIISEEGFEHILAVDYTGDAKEAPAPPRKITAAATPSATPQKQPAKSRPTSQSFFSRAPPVELDRIATSSTVAPPVPGPTTAPADTKRSRRSLSFDFKGLFGGDKKAAAPPPDANAGLRQLTLRPGANSTVVGSARKLETHEDDDDRRERERLNATMKLMGIDPPPTSPLTPRPPATSMSMMSSLTASTSGASAIEPRSPGPATATPSRFSFFRSRSNTANNTANNSSNNSTENVRANQQPLTSEALERVEAEQSIAQLDAREKEMSVELGKGKGSGFTEIPPRGSLGDEWRSRRSRKSGKDSSAGSTVFSAGKTDADSIRNDL